MLVVFENIFGALVRLGTEDTMSIFSEHQREFHSSLGCRGQLLDRLQTHPTERAPLGLWVIDTFENQVLAAEVSIFPVYLHHLAGFFPRAHRRERHTTEIIA